MKKLFKEFLKGIFRENPTFALALGLCQTLAVSTSIVNGFGMGVAATFVILGSNIIVSAIRNFIPSKIRIPCFIVIIATFVTIVELVMKAYFPLLSKALGIFVPLIVVNCIVMARAEAFASKHTVVKSIFDGLGMGAGFTLALVLISGIREAFGNGTLLGLVIVRNFEPALLFILAPGALLVIGILIGIVNLLSQRR
ncbi:MAG: electron transport complex subunit E [Candidatus Omnitrophica bacterium]|nr:electron transport complex subunit E [Candidatus Omnitrophota bacterium]